MRSLKRNSIVLFCLLFSCCQKIDPTTAPNTGKSDELPQASGIQGTGLGTVAFPYSVADIRKGASAAEGDVWVIGYVVGTAPSSMAAATFLASATNQSNILLSSDSLCTDTARCIPVELTSTKMRQQFALPNNRARFRKCVMLCGTPGVYLRNRRGLRNTSAGLWLDNFDISEVAPQEWGIITLP